jgi:hypothetical protein
MHWFGTTGKGSVKKAGMRPGGDAANGNAVMFDSGKILTCGGSEAFALPKYPDTAVRFPHACNACIVLLTVHEQAPTGASAPGFWLRREAKRIYKERLQRDAARTALMRACMHMAGACHLHARP